MRYAIQYVLLNDHIGPVVLVISNGKPRLAVRLDGATFLSVTFFQRVQPQVPGLLQLLDFRTGLFPGEGPLHPLDQVLDGVHELLRKAAVVGYHPADCLLVDHQTLGVVGGYLVHSRLLSERDVSIRISGLVGADDGIRPALARHGRHRIVPELDVGLRSDLLEPVCDLMGNNHASRVFSVGRNVNLAVLVITVVPAISGGRNHADPCAGGLAQGVVKGSVILRHGAGILAFRKARLPYCGLRLGACRRVVLTGVVGGLSGGGEVRRLFCAGEAFHISLGEFRVCGRSIPCFANLGNKGLLSVFTEAVHHVSVVLDSFCPLLLCIIPLKRLFHGRTSLCKGVLRGEVKPGLLLERRHGISVRKHLLRLAVGKGAGLLAQPIKQRYFLLSLDLLRGLRKRNAIILIGPKGLVCPIRSNLVCHLLQCDVSRLVLVRTIQRSRKRRVSDFSSSTHHQANAKTSGARFVHLSECIWVLTGQRVVNLAAGGADKVKEAGAFPLLVGKRNALLSPLLSPFACRITK